MQKNAGKPNNIKSHQNRLGKKPNINGQAKNNSGITNRFNKNQRRNYGRSTMSQNNQNLENPEAENQTAANSTSATDMIKGKKEENVVKKIKKIKIYLFLGALGSIALLFAVLVAMISSLGRSEVTAISASYMPIGDEYIAPVCTQVSVISATDSRGNPTEGGTFDIDKYIEGVVNAEVGGMNNYEVYKMFAVAARSYFYVNSQDCSIENSTSKQRFVSNNSSMIRLAVQETKDQVILDGNGNFVNAQYDAFCTTQVTEDSYILKQNHQVVSKEWADDQRGIKPEWKEGREIECHGNGASQWGAYYLAEEYDYTYSNLLRYYYSGDDYQLSSRRIATGINGLDIKKTVNASNALNKSITTFLTEKGSSINTYNDYITRNVRNYTGTRQGPVIAVLSLINYLYDNYNTKLPYYYGANLQTIGVSSLIGDSHISQADENGQTYNYVSFDDGGLISWAMKNGGYNFDKKSTIELYNILHPSGCDMLDEDCKGSAGDLIVSPKHVMMIVYYDESNKIYYVAEATQDGIIINTRQIYDKNCGGANGVLINMQSFYSDFFNRN